MECYCMKVMFTCEIVKDVMDKYYYNYSTFIQCSIHKETCSNCTTTIVLIQINIYGKNNKNIE